MCPLIARAAQARDRPACLAAALLALALAACGPPAVPALRFERAAPEAAEAETPADAAALPAPLAAAPLAAPAGRAAYLARLRAEYGLDGVAAGAASDLERVRRLSRWARRQWEHNGSNEPARPDPLSILAEARAGRRFRCVEYAEVPAAALSAVGVPARVLGLQGADVETARSGVGHLVTEAYLRHQRRWVVVDGQWDVIPFRGAEPLHAVGLQRALAERDPALRVESRSGTGTRRYARWVAPYLYYFVATPRPWATGVADGPEGVMRVPLRGRAPSVFQRRFARPRSRATHSEPAFYAAPPAG
jgi:hypothetical protein